MGVPTSEVGYTPPMPRREDHEVHKEHVVALGGGDIRTQYLVTLSISEINVLSDEDRKHLPDS